MRFAAYGLGIFSICWGIMVVLVLSFACRPLAYSWDKSIAGSCINQTKFLRIASSFNVVTDFTIVVLPLPPVWRLHSPVRQKLQISIIFLLASL